MKVANMLLGLGLFIFCFCCLDDDYYIEYNCSIVQ